MRTRHSGWLVIAAVWMVACGPTSSGEVLQTQQQLTGDPSYVLLAPGNWGKKQDAAVAAAGGTLVSVTKAIGVGTATSTDPDFEAKAEASGAFVGVAADQLLDWTPDAKPVPAAIEPAAESFFGYQWNMQAMNAPQAWAAGCTGKGVRVAILDGGIDAAHLDLAANIDLAASTSMVPGYAFDQDVGTFWHGSHVAGIVAAAANSKGVIGVAPEATLIGVKVLHDGSGAFSWIIQGIAYAATAAKADIINMSLGANLPRNCTFPETPDDAGGHFPAECAVLVAALNRAVNFATSQGTLVVSAAGNDAVDFDHAWQWTTVPAESGNGIAVSATGPYGFAYGATDYRRVASYTNYGSSLVHVAAPGGDFALPYNYWWYDMVLSTNIVTSAGHTYTWAAGTSMAAPAAAGVAALIKQQHPGAKPGLLKNLLANSADDEGAPGVDPYYGRGFVNAYKACVQ